MKLEQPITEDEMIAIFLAGEIASQRFGDKVHEATRRLSISEHIVTNPDLNDEYENQSRRKLLLEARGYGSDTSWFSGWHKNISWYKASIEHTELKNVRYIVYSYWIELTHGSLRAGDAISTIQKGDKIYGVDNKPFLDAAKAIKQGVKLPPMILAGTGVGDLVVLEGHLRLTAYLLAADRAPRTIDVLVGISPAFVNWKMYSFASYNTKR